MSYAYKEVEGGLMSYITPSSEWPGEAELEK